MANLPNPSNRLLALRERLRVVGLVVREEWGELGQAAEAAARVQRREAQAAQAARAMP